MVARETLFGHEPPPSGLSATDNPIHPLQKPRCCQKSSSFSLFLSGHCFCIFLSPESPLFLCFLKLYDIFRTLGVVSIDSYLFLISMVERDVSMAKKGQTFNSFVSGTPMITLDKLTRSKNYQSWANSMDRWFIGNGCEDYLTTADTNCDAPSLNIGASYIKQEVPQASKILLRFFFFDTYI